MKKLMLILWFCSLSACAQNTRLSLLQGIWEYSMNDETERSFKVVAGKKCLGFSYTSESDDFTLFEMIIGFQNSASGFNNGDEIYADSLKSDGLYYTEIISEEYIDEDGLVKRPNFLTPFYFAVDENVLSINGGKLFEYVKISDLPYSALSCLFQASNRNKQDYVKEYLNLAAFSIKPEKCTVYSAPNRPTNILLKEKHLVIVLEESKDWLKVKYSENDIGWIKRTDVGNN
jgi:hypothetical protein